MKNPAATPSLPVTIADAIRSDIVEGRLLVGDRLPSEAELADQHGVSRATVREALKRLAAQSLIRTERGAFERDVDTWERRSAIGRIDHATEASSLGDRGERE